MDFQFGYSQGNMAVGDAERNMHTKFGENCFPLDLHVKYPKLGFLANLGVKIKRSTFLAPKGTSFHQNTHFDVLFVQIGQPLRPVGIFKKQKKRTPKYATSAYAGEVWGGPIPTKSGGLIGPDDVMNYA